MDRPSHHTHKKALRRAFWASLGKLIGVGLGASAGSLVHELTGSGMTGWFAAALMAAVSFALVMFAEYEREIG